MMPTFGTNPPKNTIFTASRNELTNSHYVRRLWIAARNVKISRRKWPDEIARAIYGFKGRILCSDNRLWPVPDVDAVLGDARWFSYWFEADDTRDDYWPKREVRLLERIRIIDLYFRIDKPDIARHFGL